MGASDEEEASLVGGVHSVEQHTAHGQQPVDGDLYHCEAAGEGDEVEQGVADIAGHLRVHRLVLAGQHVQHHVHDRVYQVQTGQGRDEHVVRFQLLLLGEHDEKQRVADECSDVCQPHQVQGHHLRSGPIHSRPGSFQNAPVAPIHVHNFHF